jgi:hypothetical protein
MPINIYRDDTSKIAWLCDGDWSLPNQVDALTVWLEENGKNIRSGSYVADIGFRWRRDAGGGGSALTPETMKIMSEIGMCLFLSEYSGFSDSESKESSGANET